ncbi:MULTISPECIES: iron-containing alcohol dehydrogenase [unclassified Shinella]|uniref:iron-containing alcohol dehydrogenase n=1 Tax=unclassified Shinella TaxID=2643062 RepID=UPI00234E78E3|nr:MULTISPECIES: iron-containing alcohol dehydrogenase [unclassified Shinella]MCO5152015.1 iron-containing alcohol dehydrogenase [Shinella sp.]MDC7266569.1 iron-containing alcohol dehydrogenase [Shinella sp. HY16]MDC7273466.1 iron-containing alcohol dehydrogenase [Shinella sp. YZ44]
MTDIHYWTYPTEIFCGKGAVERLAHRCRLAGATYPLLVTDPGLLTLPPMQKVRACLDEAGIRYDVFHALSGNPTFEEAQAGGRAFVAGGHDLVIAVGGGSAIDVAKGIALTSRDPQGLRRFEWSELLARYATLADFPALALPSLFVVPTTAGTGSELGREAVLTDTALGIKKIIGHRDLLAACVFLDPLLTTGLPPALTAATGMDALTHHLESLFSPLHHPMSAGVATEGVRLVHAYLERAVNDGNDLEAREGMLVASASAAVAFQKGLGGVHALAHPIGARHHLHHGLLNAVLLPYVLVANRPAIEEHAARLARYLDLPGAGFDGLMAWLLALRTRIGIPPSLVHLGLDGTDADWVGAQALADISSSDTNARPLGADDYAAIYRKAVAGSLEVSTT